MSPARAQSIAKTVIIPSLIVTVLGTGFVSARADDSGFFGRLFRSGSSSSGSSSSNSPSSLPYGSGGNFVPPSSSSTSSPASTSSFGHAPEGPSTPNVISPSSAPAQRVAPKPRVTPAVTTSDPLLTRFALARSNDGAQFGMSLQVFADGTVLDSEGIHYLRPADMKPILDLVQSGDLGRLHGHCGAPSTDYTEYVQIVAFERRLGRLMANQFSYSGNPQGCDHAIRHLHTVLENLQAKISRQPASTPTAAGNTAPAPTSAPVITVPGSSTPIQLSPSAAAAPSTTTPPAAATTPVVTRQPRLPAYNPGPSTPTGSIKTTSF
jgi:hypothetical protein